MPKPVDGHKRVVVEGVTPEIDSGRFPIKRIVGDVVVVEADVFADGHDQVIARLLFQRETVRRYAASSIELRGKGVAARLSSF